MPLIHAVYLYPLNGHLRSQIHLPRRRLARQDQPSDQRENRFDELNGYFDSKILLRQHVEVWGEGGRIFIKDIKSSNGTFINSECLSAEGVESDAFKLKTDDVVVCTLY